MREGARERRSKKESGGKEKQRTEEGKDGRKDER